MVDLLLKLGGFQAIILAIFLFRKKTNNTANLILSFLVFSLGISCLFYSFNSLEFYLRFPHLIRLNWGIPLLFGPLVYLYTSSLIKGPEQTKKYFVHFLPYVINLIILAPFFIKSSEEKIQVLDYFTASITAGIDAYFVYDFILSLTISISSLWYAFESLKLIGAYRYKLLNEYANTEQLMLQWLRVLLYSFMFISIVFIAVSIITFGDRYTQFDYNVFYFLSIFVLIYILSYKALSQPKMINFAYMDPEIKKTLGPKVRKKNLSQEAIRLQTFMSKQKPYLNGALTASDLAKDVQLSRHQLSQILNEELGNNFYDFINEYRVEEFKNSIGLKENGHLTLLGLALNAGFNSKTTFNTIFKKATGMTPSAYKKNINK